MIPYERLEIHKNHTLSGGTYLSSPSIYGIIPPPPPKTSRVTWQASRDLDDECQVIHEFSVVKCCLSYLNIFEFKRDSYLFSDMSQEVTCLS